MRKTLSLLVTMGLIFGAFAMPAEAKKKKKKKKKPVRIERVQESRYEMPWGASVLGAGLCSGCPSFPNTSEEVWIKVKVVDDNAPVAEVGLSWDTDGDGVSDTSVNVCGETDGFVEIPGGVSPTAFPRSVGGPNCPGSAATSGSIKVTYSNMP